MKFLFVLVSVILLACTTEGKADDDLTLQDIIEQLNYQEQDPNSKNCKYVSINEKHPECLKGHTDSIIPIVYGMPGPDLFAQADSGIVAIGGCELSDCDPYWWCKIHELGF